MVTVPEPESGSETDHGQKRRFRHSAIYQTMKNLAILKYLHGWEMVLLGVVVRNVEMPCTNILQENIAVSSPGRPIELSLREKPW